MHTHTLSRRSEAGKKFCKACKKKASRERVTNERQGARARSWERAARSLRRRWQSWERERISSASGGRICTQKRKAKNISTHRYTNTSTHIRIHVQFATLPLWLQKIVLCECLEMQKRVKNSTGGGQSFVACGTQVSMSVCVERIAIFNKKSEKHLITSAQVPQIKSKRC